MNKKGLLLIAAAILATSCFSQTYVSAEVVKSSGSIIRQMMPMDNEMELREIMDRELKDDFTEFDKLIEVYLSYETYNMFDRADTDFSRLLEEIEQTKKLKDKKEKIQKLQMKLISLTLQEPYNSRYFFKQYLFESLFGSYEEAVKALRSAYSLDKNNPVYLSEMAKIYLNENDYDKAIKIFEALKRNYPRELNYRLALGQVYSQAGMYEDAIREYRVATAFDPDNNDAIVALNELIPYTLMQQQGARLFYDPMKAVKQEKVQVQNEPVNKVVAFSTAQTTQGSHQTNTVPVNNTKTAGTIANNVAAGSQTQGNLVSTSNFNQKKTQSKKNVNKAPKTAPGSKRVMVTYVNGRKVVKIVNINSEANSGSTLQDASSTFSNQLDEMNSGYDTTGTSNTTNTIKVAPSSSSYGTSDSDMTTSQYQTISGNSYVQTSSAGADDSSEYTSSGDPNVNSLAYNTSGRKQLVVTYENGKKKVKTVGANGSYISETKNSAKLQKEQEKLRKKEAKEKAKLEKLEKQQKTSSVQNTQTTARDNSDIFIKANELMVQEDFSGAIAVLKTINPQNLRSLTTIASCYNSLGQTDTAIDYYKQADKMSPNNPQILYSLAYLYFTQNDTAQAKKYIDASLKIDPSNQNSLKLKQYMAENVASQTIDSAVSYMNQGNYSAAKKILDKVVVEHPNDFQAYYYLGHISYATQKYEDATKHFLMAIKINPDYALSYYSIGLAYDKLKEFNKSIAAYQQFLQMETDDNRYTQYAQTRINTIKSKQ